MKVYVIDTETTGLKGFPYDVVLDIGIVSLELDDGTVDDVYNATVGGYPVDDWPERMKNCWAYQNTELTLEQTRLSRPYYIIAEEVKGILENKMITSYNVAFDFSRFLGWYPWNLNLGKFHWCDCIMIAASQLNDVPLHEHDDGMRYPKLIDVYESIVDGDPANLGGKQAHLALSDARVAAYVLYELYQRNLWPMTEKNTFRNGDRIEELRLSHI